MHNRYRDLPLRAMFVISASVKRCGYAVRKPSLVAWRECDLDYRCRRSINLCRLTREGVINWSETLRFFELRRVSTLLLDRGFTQNNVIRRKTLIPSES